MGEGPDGGVLDVAEDPQVELGVELLVGRAQPEQRVVAALGLREEGRDEADRER